MLFASRFAGRLWLAAVFAAGLPAQQLAVRIDSGAIRASASKSQFLEGTSLERLRGGAPIVFAVQLSLLNSSKSAVLVRSAGRFAVSFDIWEEKYAVTHLTTPSKSASHLAGPEAEAWCFDNLALAGSGLSTEEAFWIRLDVRAELPAQDSRSGEEIGVTLARLVELFSRPQREGEPRKRIEAGPFRIKDLR